MNFSLVKSYGCILLEFCEKYGIKNAFRTDEGLVHRSFDGVFMETLTLPNGWLGAAALLFCAIIGYLLGSINFAVIISKVFYRDDVRSHGSGNAGATNMLRTYGRGAGAATFILDGVKAAVAVLISMLLMGEGGAYIAGLFCILGHIFPVYYKFKGGKGVVVSAITILVLNPMVFLCLLALFVLIVGWSKYISLGSVICAFFFPLLQNAFSQGQGFLSSTVSVLIAAIVIVMHRSNIKRLMNRTESKVSFAKKKD
jgi:glycerol-3-phosphate acyltransferase PlsY